MKASRKYEAVISIEDSGNADTRAVQLEGFLIHVGYLRSNCRSLGLRVAVRNEQCKAEAVLDAINSFSFVTLHLRLTKRTRPRNGITCRSSNAKTKILPGSNATALIC